MYNKKLFDKLIKKNNPLISIICPTRNRWEILFNRAMNTIYNQSYKNWEWIIIDDDSNPPKNVCLSSNPCNWIRSKRIKFYRLSPKVLHYPDEPMYHWLVGPVRALNKGLELAKGDWIARIDDDTFWTEFHLENMLHYCRDYKWEFGSAGDMMDGKWIEPYSIEGQQLGSCQTWLYAGYLKEFKYSLDSWQKNWNKNNDIDLPERMFKAGVKSGYIPEINAFTVPRPGNKLSGSKGWLEEWERKQDEDN